MRSRRIQLSLGKEAIVDEEDYSRLIAMGSWYAKMSHAGSRTLYAARKKNGARSLVYMHRVILNAPSHLQVDHINGNGLDNRKSNIRLCAQADNLRNRGANKHSSSKFKGVVWDKQHNKWRAQIGSKGKTLFLGCFEDQAKAARAYDAQARELHGDFAKLNFP